MFYILYVFLISTFISGCSKSPSQADLYKQKPAFYTYIVGEVTTNKILDEYAADVYATPASCQKVITALLAYKILGPEHCYTTHLFKMKRPASQQEAMLVFSGDPLLTSEHLRTLLSPLKHPRFQGTLTLDSSVFQVPPHSPHIMIEDIGTRYGQPVSGMIIDRNLITLTIKPTSPGQPAQLSVDVNYELDAHVTTSHMPSKIAAFWDQDRICVRGYINDQESQVKIYVSPINIRDFIVKKIKKLHIIPNMKIVFSQDRQSVPLHRTLIQSVTSCPLKQTLPPALKTSDNLFFDSLHLTVLNTCSVKAIKTWDDSDALVKTLLKQHWGIDTQGARFVDGSGLSRHNRIQPRVLFQILKQAYNLEDLVNALPYPTEKDSTLELRQTLPSTMRAKTGMMSGVSCLCGYHALPSQTPQAFVMIAQGFTPPHQEMLNVIDSFLVRYFEKQE